MNPHIYNGSIAVRVELLNNPIVTRSGRGLNSQKCSFLNNKLWVSEEEEAQEEEQDAEEDLNECLYKSLLLLGTYTAWSHF